jgi:hypothetical protein
MQMCPFVFKLLINMEFKESLNKLAFGTTLGVVWIQCKSFFILARHTIKHMAL